MVGAVALFPMLMLAVSVEVQLPVKFAVAVRSLQPYADRSNELKIQLPDPFAVTEPIEDPSTYKDTFAFASLVPLIDVVVVSIGDVVITGLLANVCDPQLLDLQAEFDAVGQRPLVVSSKVTTEEPHGIFTPPPVIEKV